MYKKRHPYCSTSSVLSGIKLSSMRRTLTITGWRTKSCCRFETSTSIYIKVPILPQHGSPPPLQIMTLFCSGHPHIQSAMSLAIFTITLLPQLFLALARMTTLCWPLRPFPVPIHLPRPHLPNIMSTKPSPFHPAYQTNIGSLRIPVSSLGPATASAIQDIVTSDITILHPTPETSKSAPSSTPPAAVTLQHNPDLLTSSDPPNLPSSSSSNPALDNTLPTGTTAPSASPRPTSAPDLGAAAEGDGSPQPGSHKEKDALGLPSVNRAIHANTTATLDLPPQSPSLRPITDSDAAVVGPSPWEPNTELTGDQRSSSACFASPV
ncbi:hypothetical protein BJY52DRAFT_1419460 [Lactarius psammicola]|nr:hypothetical protein BJY52DRAFT_1419460 [Lactarius psammicola]